MKSYLKENSSHLHTEVSESDAELLTKALVLTFKENEQIDQAINLLKSSNRDSISIILLLAEFYHQNKDFINAEKYYLKSLESGDNVAKDSLAWFYFELATKKESALKNIVESCAEEENFFNLYYYAVILLWLERFDNAYEKFTKLLEYDGVLENNNISIYLTLLMAKGQYYKAKEFFELPKYQLKERYKPLWYVLMSLMQKEFPHEIKKMGSELKETVAEILKEVEVVKTKYAS